MQGGGSVDIGVVAHPPTMGHLPHLRSLWAKHSLLRSVIMWYVMLLCVMYYVLCTMYNVLYIIMTPSTVATPADHIKCGSRSVGDTLHDIGPHHRQTRFEAVCIGCGAHASSDTRQGLQVKHA